MPGKSLSQQKSRLKAEVAQGMKKIQADDDDDQKIHVIVTQTYKGSGGSKRTKPKPRPRDETTWISENLRGYWMDDYDNVLNVWIEANSGLIKVRL